MLPARPVPARPVLAAALIALALLLAGCGTSGYGTVDLHRVVFIATAPAAGPGGRASAALVCGARVEARRLGLAFRLARPRRGSASAQIAVADAVTAAKPGGVLIVPVAADPLLAPILSMRRAGIRVVALPAAPRDAARAAAAGARALLRVARTRRRPPAGRRRLSSLLAPCIAAR